MDYFEVFTTALIKEIPKFTGTLIVLTLGWLIGMRITHYWNIKKTKRELDLESLNNFQLLYGEFFSIWKLWNYYLENVGDEKLQKDFRCQTMDRASTSEGKLEALLVRLSCEKILNQRDIRTLGLFRQGYQQLRESISEGVPLNWNSSKDPEYWEFKGLSPRVQKMLLRESSLETIDNELAKTQLRGITSNVWENEWLKIRTKK